MNQKETLEITWSVVGSVADGFVAQTTFHAWSPQETAVQYQPSRGKIYLKCSLGHRVLCFIHFSCICNMSTEFSHWLIYVIGLNEWVIFLTMAKQTCTLCTMKCVLQMNSNGRATIVIHFICQRGGTIIVVDLYILQKESIYFCKQARCKNDVNCGHFFLLSQCWILSIDKLQV